jgi:uncharacterized protein (TIGR02996 family)
MIYIIKSSWIVQNWHGSKGLSASGILSVPGAGETQVSDVEARINNKYAGPNNAGKIWVMGQRPDSRGMSYQPLRPDPASMSYETRSVFEGLILAAVCGIDRKVAGLAEGGSYSDRWAAIQDVRHRKYEPWLSKIAAMLTNGPMRQWGLAQRGVRARVQLPRLNDPVMTQADTNAMAADGTGTVDEVRARRGQGPHPSGLGNYPANVMVQILGLQAEAGNVQVKPPQPEGTQTIAEPPADDSQLGQLLAGMAKPAAPRADKASTKGSLPGRPKQAAKGGGKKTGKRQTKGTDVENLERHLASNPGDAAARGAYADALDEEGRTKEGALHRYVAFPHDESRFHELAAAHGGDYSAAALAMSEHVHKEVGNVYPPRQDPEEYEPHYESQRARTHAHAAVSSTGVDSIEYHRHASEVHGYEAYGMHGAAVHYHDQSNGDYDHDTRGQEGEDPQPQQHELTHLGHLPGPGHPHPERRVRRARLGERRAVGTAARWSKPQRSSPRNGDDPDR